MPNSCGGTLRVFDTTPSFKMRKGRDVVVPWRRKPGSTHRRRPRSLAAGPTIGSPRSAREITDAAAGVLGRASWGGGVASGVRRHAAELAALAPDYVDRW